jgi:hypothetical protein
MFSEFSQSFLETLGFRFNYITVLLVHFVQLQKLVILVCVSAEHGTVRTDWHLACLAVVFHFVSMFFADLHTIFNEGSVCHALCFMYTFILVFVKHFNMLSDLLYESVAAD